MVTEDWGLYAEYKFLAFAELDYSYRLTGTNVDLEEEISPFMQNIVAVGARYYFF